MKQMAELGALKHAVELCNTHAQALSDALADIETSRPRFTVDALGRLGKEDRRLLDQFAYRYPRLQDDMGAKLLPSVLLTLGEDVSAMAAIDRLNRLEQLRWLPSAEAWMELRRIRNEFAHDYPEGSRARHERLQLALTSARRLLDLFGMFDEKIRDRFQLNDSLGNG